MAVGMVMMLATGVRATEVNAIVTAEESYTQTVEVIPAKLDISMFNGAIEVAAGPGKIIVAYITKRGSGSSPERAREDIKSIEVKVTGTKELLQIVARRTDQRQDAVNSGASIKLQMPVGIPLNLKTSNGSIQVIGPAGEVAAQTSNAKIETKATAGSLNLKTSNAPISASGGAGKILAETSNDNIEIITKEALVSAVTSNGRINFSGKLLSGHHQFTSGNGEITLTLPGGASFEVEAVTSNAKVNSDFKSSTPIDSENAATWHGQVGTHPDAFLKIETSNSDINLLKSQNQ